MFLYDFCFCVYPSFNHSSDNSAMLVYFYGDHQVEGVIGSVIDQIEAFASAGGKFLPGGHFQVDMHTPGFPLHGHYNSVLG